MAQTALPARRTAPPRRRALFGLLDADGWGWASVKALFWFVLIIILLGYIPDRAYYFTVQRTVDLGLLAWSPVNFCPAENETLPCPAPVGASLPWHLAPEQLQLPSPREGGVAAALGETFLYAGGSDGSGPVATTYVAHATGSGNFGPWSEGPALPEPREDAASVVLGTTLYILGGLGPDGQPTDTVYSIGVGSDGALGEWKAEEGVALPGPRAGASAVAVADGIVVMGGANADGPTSTVWKSRQNASGALQAWAEQSPLVEPNVDGLAVHVGDVIFLIGGRNASGEPVATVQQGLVGVPGGDPEHPEAAPTADPAEDPNTISALWRASTETNLPAPRADLAGFTANGVIYVQGGSDGSAPRADTWWAVPDANGVIPAWHNLAQTNLGQGIEGSAAMVSGSHAFLVGGRTPDGLTTNAARTNLAPQAPFFQLGLLGATVPALRLEGEIGQQIGYLNAAGVGTVNFVLLLLVGWAFAHRDRVRSFVEARRRRRG